MIKIKTSPILPILFLIAVGTDFVYAQDSQLWTDYNLTVPVPNMNKFTYGGDVAWRRGGDTGLQGFVSEADFNQIIIRPTARYRFNQIFNVGAGTGGFFSFNNGSGNIYEFRIQEEVNIRWPDLSVLALFYRVRFDQRFFSIEDAPNDRTGRVRYLIGMDSDDIRTFGRKKPIYLQLFWEGFKTLGRFSINDTFINQDRWTGIFGHRISNTTRYEINYINQRQRTASETEFKTTQHIIRLRFFHRLAPKESPQSL